MPLLQGDLHALTKHAFVQVSDQDFIDRIASINSEPMIAILRKEVIQPQVPLRLPCYDLVPVTEPSVGITVV